MENNDELKPLNQTLAENFENFKISDRIFNEKALENIDGRILAFGVRNKLWPLVPYAVIPEKIDIVFLQNSDRYGWDMAGPGRNSMMLREMTRRLVRLSKIEKAFSRIIKNEN